MTSKSVFSRKAHSLLCLPLSLAMYSACSAPEPIQEEGNVNASAFALGANSCMDDLFPGTLNCTANDVRIARANNISVPSCMEGADVSFTADFQVVAGTTRYDVGLYFATDGDPNDDGALTGECAVNMITPQNSPTFISMDPPPDICGDVQAGQTQFVKLQITTKCIDDDGDGKLNLPYCTSWRQPGSNQICNQPEQAFPGSPSKCRCDRSFNIDVAVEQPSLTVVKSASAAAIDEPGGLVTYTVTVTNNGVVTSVVLTDFVDDPDNNPSTNNSVVIPLSNCDKQNLAPGQTATCTFTAGLLGNAGESFTDKACVSAVDGNGRPVAAACDTATVTIRDVRPMVALTKTVEKIVSVVVQYQVNVENDGDEPIALDSLHDNQFGDITQVQGDVVATSCGLNNTEIPSKSSFSCSFDANVTTFPHTNIVTGAVHDNDGNSVSLSDDATVSVTMSAP